MSANETSSAKERALRKCSDKLRQAIAANKVKVSFKLYQEELIPLEVRQGGAVEMVCSVESLLASDEAVWDKLVEVLRECELHALAGNLDSQLREELRREDRTHLVRKEMMPVEDDTSQSKRQKVSEGVDILEAKLVTVEKAHHEDQMKINALEKAHLEDQLKIAALEKAHVLKIAALEKAHVKEQLKVVALENAHHNDGMKLNLQDLQKKNASLQDENEKLSRKLAELVAHTGPMWLVDLKGILSSPYVPCTIVMSHFSKHKRDGDGQWYSCPFYSAPGGYKLCFNVCANGYGDGAGTHISVFVVLMKGENDPQLQWPFEHSVTYQILNWRKDANHMLATTFLKNAPTTIKARVTSGERASTGWGHSKVLPHTSLLDCKDKDIAYLHQDCLCVQVLKVEPPE